MRLRAPTCRNPCPPFPVPRSSSSPKDRVAAGGGGAGGGWAAGGRGWGNQGDSFLEWVLQGLQGRSTSWLLTGNLRCDWGKNHLEFVEQRDGRASITGSAERTRGGVLSCSLGRHSTSSRHTVFPWTVWEWPSEPLRDLGQGNPQRHCSRHRTWLVHRITTCPWQERRATEPAGRGWGCFPDAPIPPGLRAIYGPPAALLASALTSSSPGVPLSSPAPDGPRVTSRPSEAAQGTCAPFGLCSPQRLPQTPTPNQHPTCCFKNSRFIFMLTWVTLWKGFPAWNGFLSPARPASYSNPSSGISDSGPPPPHPPSPLTSISTSHSVASSLCGLPWPASSVRLTSKELLCFFY